MFRNKVLSGLQLGPIGPALASTVASTYPVASASSSVTYAYDPELGTFERRTGVPGPIMAERAETIGWRQINLGMSYSYVRLTSINGDDLGNLENRTEIDGRVVSKSPKKGMAFLRDGRLTTFLPVLVLLDLDVDAQIVTPGITYGITPDLDVNLTVPLIRSFLRVTTNTQTPDPRLPQFALPPGDPNAGRETNAFSDSAVGVGDILLRTKYVLRRERPFDIAAGLGLSLPSGSDQDFHGTGNTRVQPSLILSRIFAQRFEPVLDVGLDINANNAGRSVVRWSTGATAQIRGPLAVAVAFLGRHELSEQTDRIKRPFFFQIERNDLFDAAVGLRYRIMESGVIVANAAVPLNHEGLRADVIPTVEVEYAF